MKILALIPARGGSKRLPGKNIKPLGGVPLIGWSIKTALASRCFADVLVSTDDQEIADVAIQQGASVPWLRPMVLASDTATSVDVVVHALDQWEHSNGQLDAVMLLQPTSPLRTVDSIQRALRLFESKGGQHPVVSVGPAASHPNWCFRMTATGTMEPFLGWEGLEVRSQDLEPAWTLNGSIYVISPSQLRAKRSFLATDTFALQMSDPDESIDVDTLEDFERCEQVLRSGRRLVP